MFCVSELCAIGIWVDSTGSDPGDSSSPLEVLYITVDGRQVQGLVQWSLVGSSNATLVVAINVLTLQYR